jgi:hypothetical protein
MVDGGAVVPATTTAVGVYDAAARIVRASVARLRAREGNGDITQGCSCSHCSSIIDGEIAFASRHSTVFERSIDRRSLRESVLSEWSNEGSTTDYVVTPLNTSDWVAAAGYVSTALGDSNPQRYRSLNGTVAHATPPLEATIRFRIGVDDIFESAREAIVDHLVRIEMAAMEYFRLANIQEVQILRQMAIAANLAAWEFGIIFRFGNRTPAGSSEIRDAIRRVISLTPVPRLLVACSAPDTYYSWATMERDGYVGLRNYRYDSSATEWIQRALSGRNGLQYPVVRPLTER